MSEMTKSGLWLLDKPIGMTSRNMINIIAKKIGTSKVGHTGTLDPQASGLMIVLAGESRKLQPIFCNYPKRYTTTIRLGAYSETDDEEGPIHDWPAEAPSHEKIDSTLALFRGTISQVPPIFSAIKIKGKRAYNMARKGQKVEISAREVNIYGISLLRYEYPLLSLDITCSAGTYIRSLGRDIGEKAGTRGYIQELRRLEIGEFSVAQAATVEDMPGVPPYSLEKVLCRYPKIVLLREDWHRVKSGQRIPYPHRIGPEELAFLWIEERVVAMARTEADAVSTKKLLVTDL